MQTCVYQIHQQQPSEFASLANIWGQSLTSVCDSQVSFNSHNFRKRKQLFFPKIVDFMQKKHHSVASFVHINLPKKLIFSIN